MTIILFVLVFGVIVIAHELGHFLIARMNGIHVVEFAIGMGPKLIKLHGKETEYSIRLFPIGGACVFEGDDGVMDAKGAASERSILSANVWSRIMTVFAGPLFNFILAFIFARILVS